MQQLLAESLLADAYLDLIVPAYNGSDPDQIINSPQRTNVFFDEVLQFYLLVRPASSGVKLPDPAQLIDLVYYVDIQVNLSVADSAGTAAFTSTLSLATQHMSPSTYASPTLASVTPTSLQAMAARTRSSTLPATHSAGYSKNTQRRPTGAADSLGPIASGIRSKGSDVPRLGLERNEELVFWYSYHHQLPEQHPLVSSAGFILLPLRVPLDISRARMDRARMAFVGLNVTIALKPSSLHHGAIGDPNEWCDTEEFDYVNLLDGLVDDPSFNPDNLPVHRLPHAYRKQANPAVAIPPRSLSKNLRVGCPLDVKLSVSAWSGLGALKSGDNGMLLSVAIESQIQADSEVEGGAHFNIQNITVEIPNAVVIRCEDGLSNTSGHQTFPIRVNQFDEVDFLFHVMLLDDVASTASDTASDSRRASHMNLAGDPARSGSMTFSRAGSTASLADSTIGGATGLAGATGRTLRQVCVTIDGTPNMPGLQGQLLTSRWYARFDPRALTLAAKHYRSPGAGVMGRQNLVPQHGKRFTESVVVLHAPMLPNARNNVPAPYFQTHLSRTMSIPGFFGSDDDDGLGEGIALWFAVSAPVRLRKMFTVQVFVVNRSPRTRFFTLVIPNKLKPLVEPHPHTYMARGDHQTGAEIRPESAALLMQSEEFMTRYLEAERREASIVCLENNVRIGPLQPFTCQTVNLHFIAIKGSLHSIELVQLVDHDLRRVTDIRDVLTVYATGD
ncbi:TRAPP trafficking subunit Trs65-domain-containing protein [Cladochytrium replicatum]|nr:TRAPP trafficking subunit Trs65-domain-containing protein [Cladochytrium replicatum]